MNHNLCAVGIPIVGLPSWELMRSIVGLNSPHGFRYITSGEYRRPLPIDDARNKIVKEFLSDKKLEWLLFVDSDAVLHNQTLNRLLSWDKPIVSALCFTRRVPIVPSFYGEQNDDGYYEVNLQTAMNWLASHPQLLTKSAAIIPKSNEALMQSPFVGMHATLIKREVIEAMEPPYFVMKREEKVGEDVFFCLQAAKLGYKSYVDMSVVAGHQSLHEFAGLDFQAWALWMQQQKKYLSKNVT